MKKLRFTKALSLSAAAILAGSAAIAQSSSSSNTLTGTLPASPTEYLGSFNTADVLFKSNNIERMRINSAGSILMGGTPSPATTLSLSTNSTNAGIRITQTGGTAGSLGLYNNSAGAHNYALFSTGNLNSEGAGHFGVYDYTAPGYRFFIHNNGNTAIGGTATPQTKLHVVGNGLFTTSFGSPTSAAYIRANTTYSSATTPEFTWWNNDQTGFFHPALNILGVTINGTERMRVNASGFVGIGTTNPAHKLHVDNGAIFVTGSNSSGGPMVVLGGGGVSDPNGQWGIEYEGTAQGLNFWRPFPAPNSGNYFLFLSNNGNIGIGTSTPAYKLDVCGTVRAKEVKVEIGWCDYVFEKGYKLRSLDEVEKFIEVNKHLPDVPSAKQIETDGLKLAEMQATHMLKIEELTLYILELKKENEALAKRMEQLEKK